jgi:hypothetical protein
LYARSTYLSVTASQLLNLREVGPKTLKSYSVMLDHPKYFTHTRLLP